MLLVAAVLAPCRAGAAAASGDAAVTAAEVSRLMAEQPGEVALVDIRPPSRFNAVHVPGSVNVAPYAVKARDVLRKRRVVLVADPVAFCAAGAVRENLLANGFSDVRVLAGGVLGWLPENRSTAAAAVDRHMLRAAMDCAGIAPSIVDLRPAGDFEGRFLVGSVNVPAGKPGGESESRLAARIEGAVPDAAGRSPLAPLVLVDASGALAQWVYGFMKAPERPYVFYLEGGLRDWFLSRDFPPGQGRISSGTNVHGCPTCPD